MDVIIVVGNESTITVDFWQFINLENSYKNRLIVIACQQT